MEDQDKANPAAPVVEPDRIVAYLIGRLADATTDEQRRNLALLLDYWTSKP